ncbi:Uncharacterised protein [Salmonella enterica]|nr:hypothetical protein SeGA_3425 [Salmonella enterica subsp. enterica serovar Gaminara str. A4-567]ESH18495.1 hypothetical protein SEEGA711_03643 [Salmonella enterica subsp. enterica serovar Gaminara str. ATCC BAA-711]SUE89753.1 Uncharacterised protein [Salmonella enterica]
MKIFLATKKRNKRKNLLFKRVSYNIKKNNIINKLISLNLRNVAQPTIISCQ